MTIIYQYKVANTGLATFGKLLLRWRGSVYKLMYKEIIIYSCMYTAITLTYRLALNADQKSTFEKAVIACNQYMSFIPLSFVLGFYVTMIVGRWWKQFENFPWPDRTIFMLCCYLPGQTERKRIFRKTVARYLMFGIILIARSISHAVMKRFPTLDHIVEAGFITNEEAIMYENVECKYNKFWVPLMWANTVLVTARKEGLIQTEWGLRMVIEPLADVRDKCSLCFVYDWITVPLVYTQVVTLAVYTYFATSLVSQQFLDPSKKYPGHETDYYVPVFTLLQFFFYMGWLKVAEQLINPFGEDDDDYDINWLIDRHAAVVMALVDQLCDQCPPLVKNLHFDDMFDEVPYTEASMSSKKPIYLGSTYNLAPPSVHEQRVVFEDTDDRDSQRHRSFASNLAGSVMSLVSGKGSQRRHKFSIHSQDQDHLFSVPLEKQYANYQPIPNGRNPDTVNNVDEEIDIRKPSILRPPRMDKRPSWSSDSSLTKVALTRVANMSRDRADTDSKVRKSRKRKISFPLHLVKFFGRDSRKSSNDSSCTIKSSIVPTSRKLSAGLPAEKLEKEFEYAQEYIPLKRANVDSNPYDRQVEKGKKWNERKRKTSFNIEIQNGKDEKLPTETVNEKVSRFIVEQVSDGSDMGDHSLHKRNARKIEQAISGNAVSRAPLLSAIEEGGTITSISQLEDDFVVSPQPTIEEEQISADVLIPPNEEDNEIPIILVNGENVNNQVS